MRELDTDTKLQNLAQLFNWRLWSTGILGCGVHYLEFETSSQYEEIPFDSERELAEYVDSIINTRHAIQ
jgi:hypothetical protein